MPSAVRRANLRRAMFSPMELHMALIYSSVEPSAMGTWRASSSVEALESMRALATSFTRPWNLSPLAQKSVSQLSSRMMPEQPQGATAARITPSLASRSALAAALAIPFSRRYFTAASMSPLHSLRAFLQSIMPASVLSRRALTRAAVISAIVFLFFLNGWFRLRRMRPCLR